MGDAYDMRFGGIGRLYGEAALARLRAARVMVIGVGGVGSWAAEGLARSGVGAIDLVDLDDVCVTNTNRQLHAVSDTVGRPKVDVMAERVRAIHPGCDASAVHAFFTGHNAEELVGSGLDFVVDAIDSGKTKSILIARCRDAGVPVVVVGGAGGRRDPCAIKVDDLATTAGDGLLRRVRKTLKQVHGFSRRSRWRIPCVYSDEPPVFPTCQGGVSGDRSQASSLRLDCEAGYGTASFVTGVFGLVAASVVVSTLAGQ